MPNIASFLNLLAINFLIVSIRLLSTPKTARIGNQFAILGVSSALIGAFIYLDITPYWKTIVTILAGSFIGIFWAIKVKITSLPQMIAVLNGLGGLAAFLIGISEYFSSSFDRFSATSNIILGGITFSASIFAFFKLQGILPSRTATFPLQHSLNFLIFLILTGLSFCFIIHNHSTLFPIIAILSMLFGIMFVIPIGGADMPVIISFLNSLSGWATVSIGFSFDNTTLIIVGTIIGASGLILTEIMSKAMNRSLTSIFFGKNSSHNSTAESSDKHINTAFPQDAAFIMENSQKIIIIPGFGMAASQAQYSLKTMSDLLKNKFSVDVKFAVHPVAGRMPGHMNVLLAEANVDYSEVYSLSEINNDFSSTDVAFIIGANDITNPKAQTDPSSPIYGMPVFDVSKAKTVFFVKRSLGEGYSGVDNPLFYTPNTIMLFGDAKEITEQIVKSLESN